MIGAGTCTINANQAGNGTYQAAPQVQQSFTVGTRLADDHVHVDPAGAVDKHDPPYTDHRDGELGPRGRLHDRPDERRRLLRLRLDRVFSGARHLHRSTRTSPATRTSCPRRRCSRSSRSRTTRRADDLPQPGDARTLPPMPSDRSV